MSNDIDKLMTATAVGSVVAAKVGTDGLNAARGTVRGVSELTRNIVNAGDEGWDEDGYYVCSHFLFDFKSRQFFDGHQTHTIDNVVRWTWQDNMITIYFRDMPHRIYNVGFPERCERIHTLLEELARRDGDVLSPPQNAARLETYLTRMRSLRIRRILRYAFRGMFYGILMSFLVFAIGNLSKNRFFWDSDNFWRVWMGLSLLIFFGSVIWRKYRPLEEPKF